MKNKNSFATMLRLVSWAALFVGLLPLQGQIISIQAQDHNGTVLQNWNSGRWVLQCGSTMTCSVSADGSALILQSNGGGGSGAPGGATYSIQYNGGSSLAGISGTGLVMANSSAIPTIIPVLGTEGFIPTINTGAAGDAVLFGTAGLVDSGFAPENAANKGAANGYAPLNGSSIVPSANLPVATNSVAGVIKPDGTICTVTSGVLTCAPGVALNTLPYDYVTNDASNNEGHDLYNFVGDASNPAQNAINSAVTYNGMATIYPSALMNTPFTNASGVKVDDKRPYASLRSVTEFGAQCDFRPGGVNFTQGSRTISIVDDFFYPFDVGKTIVIVAVLNGVPTAFETKITGLTGTINGAPPFNSAQALTATAMPLATGFYSIGLGHDDTSSIQQAMSSGSAIQFPAGQCLTHKLTYTSISLQGFNSQQSSLVGMPGEDIIQWIDTSTGSGSEGNGVHIHDLGFYVNNQIDPTQGWQIINDSGTTSVSGIYRPVEQLTASSSDPLMPGWFTGHASYNTGAYNGVASITAGSSVMCTPNRYTSPNVGDVVVFPYLSSVFTTTVSSTAGTCASGNNPVTLATPVPSGQTTAVAEWFAGVSPQNLSAAIPSGSCPSSITLTNSIQPTPISESNVAPYGLIKIDGEQMSYFGHSNALTNAVGIASLASNTLLNIQCAQNGTTHVAHSVGATVVPLNPVRPNYPWPVLPTLNTNDTTPSGTASFYPAFGVGNAAMAAPISNGSTASGNFGSFANSAIENLNIGVWPTSNPQNGSTGIYLVQLPYSTHFRNIFILGPQNGIMEGAPSLETGGTWTSNQPTADATTWSNIRITSCNDFDFIAGGQNSFHDFNVYSSCYNVQNGTYTGNAAGMYFTYAWNDEQPGLINAMSHIDLHNMYEEAEFGNVPGFGYIPAYEFDIYNANWENLHVGSGTETYIGGQVQQFSGGNFNAGATIPIINYGVQNGSDHGELMVNAQPGVCNTYGSCSLINYAYNTSFSGTIGNGINAQSPPFSPQQAGGSRASWGGQNNETWNLGNTSAPFVDSNGGYIPAWEFNVGQQFEGNGFTIPTAYDPTSPNLFSVGCPVGTFGVGGCFSFKFNSGTGIQVGPNQRIVAGPYTVYVASKAQTGQATGYQLGVGVCGFNDVGQFFIPLATSPFTTISRTGNVVTATFPAMGSGVLQPGVQVTVQGVTDNSYNGTFTLISSTATTATWSQALGNSTSTGGSIAGWSVSSFQVDLTGKGLCSGGIGLNFANAFSGSDNVMVSYVDFAPVAQNWHAQNATVTNLTATASIASPSMTLTGATGTQCLHEVNGVISPTGTGDCGAGGGGSGVSSVAVTVPAWLTATGSPITSSGTIAIVSTSEAQNLFLASPGSGAGVMVPRAIIPADIPTLNQSTTGSAGSINGNTFPANAAFISGGIPYFSSTSVMASSPLMTQYGVIYGGGAGTAPGVTAADTNTAHALFATGTAPAFRAILSTDIPTLNQSTTGNAATATSASTVNGNSFPSSGGFVSGGIPFFSSTSAEGSSALLTKWGVMVGGGAGTTPFTIAASATTTQALFATAGAPAFRNLASADLPVGSGTQIGGLECGTGLSCTAGVISEATTTLNSSSTLTSGFIPAATGAATLANSKLDDGATTPNALTYTGSVGLVVGNIHASNITASGAIIPGITSNLISVGTTLTVPSIQNTTTIAMSQTTGSGSAAITLNITGGLEFTGPIEVNGSFGTAGQCLITGGSSVSNAGWGACSGGGGAGVSSIAVTTPSWLTVAGSPITSSGTIAITGTSESANLILASPNGSAGAMTPRALVAADIPTLNQSTTGSAGSVPYSGLTGSVPTWNQNTTGTAAGLTGCSTSTAGSLCYWTGTAWAVVPGNASGTQVLSENSSGTPSWSAVGGTVSNGTLGHFGYYAANGTVISSNSNLDDGVTTANTLTYGSAGGVTAKSFQSTGTGNGSLVFGGSVSGALTMTVPGTVTPYTMVWPGAAPTTGNTYLSCTAAAPSVCSWAVGGSGGSGAFSSITGGTNTTAAMLVGTGASLGFAGSGTINASNLLGNTYPGFGTFTQGGIPYFSANNVMSSTGVLAQFGVLYGGGTGAAPQATIADATATHALFATAGAPAFRAITAGDIPTLNQNTTGSSGSLTSFSVPANGSVASAATVTFPGTGGYVVVTGTATISTMTVPSGCVGGAIACTYMVLSSNGFSIQVSTTGGSSNNINATGGVVGATVTIPSGSIAYFTYDPVNGLWHFMQQPTQYNPIYVHNISGSAPTIALNSAVIAAQDTDYLTLTANTTSITLPASTAVVDGETITVDIAQPATGSPFTLAAGTAQSPLTAGSGTSLVNTVPGGCPTIGSTVSGTAPSSLVLSLTYKASLSQYKLLGCQTYPPQSAVNEATLSTGWIQMGGTGTNVVLAGTRPSNAGHFTNLQIVFGGGTCTTAPFVNIFDGTSSFGIALQGSNTYQAPGIANNQPEVLPFNAGDNIGIETSTAGSGCSTGFYMISAQYAEP